MAGLLAETRAALAHLRVEELEALAVRAEAMLSGFEALVPGTSHISAQGEAPGAQSIRREHRLLGDLLQATGENLRVLRRAQGRTDGGPRWAR